MVDGGYFPKRIEARPDFVKAPTVREICSVSDCISSGPKNWIDLWLHNEFGWFNTILDAKRITPVGQESVYRLFAYRIHREIFQRRHACSTANSRRRQPSTYSGFLPQVGVRLC